MAKKIQLTINEPCHEKWEEMTPVQQGMFCASCQKNVIDFSAMSDRQLAEFFKKPSTGSVCGRFMSEQLDRDIEIPRKRIPWIRYFFSIALPAFFLSLKSAAGKTQGAVSVKESATDTTRKPNYADLKVMGMISKPPSIRPFEKDKKPASNQPQSQCGETLMGKPSFDIIREKIPTSLPVDTPPVIRPLTEALVGKLGGVMVIPVTGKTIQLKIENEKGEPLPFASISAEQVSIGMADEQGAIRFSRKKIKTNYIEVSAAGYEAQLYFLGTARDEQGVEIIRLKMKSALPEVVLKSGGMIRQGGVTRRSVQSVTQCKIEKKTVKEAVQTGKEIKGNPTGSLFRVFPNPVPSGAAVTLEWIAAREGYTTLQLYNMNGQLLLQRELWLDTSARYYDLLLAPLPAGEYLILCLPKSGKEKYSTKLIIQ